jgi:hypothetical protein
MFVVLQQKTTTVVVVLPTLEGAWITDGTFGANGVTMIHPVGNRRLLPIRIQFTPLLRRLSSQANRYFCWVAHNLAKVLFIFVEDWSSNLRKVLH